MTERGADRKRGSSSLPSRSSLEVSPPELPSAPTLPQESRRSRSRHGIGGLSHPILCSPSAHSSLGAAPSPAQLPLRRAWPPRTRPPLGLRLQADLEDLAGVN